MPARPETQQNVARIVLKTFCEAWLEHIRGRRMKFRYTMVENPFKSLILQYRERSELSFLFRAHALPIDRFFQ